MSNDPLPEKPATKYHSYPRPESEYPEIVENPHLFSQKLQSFHAFYGTKFRVPKIGGNCLDLHKLFVEVTSRGGIEKVIGDRRWKEVIGTFNFPSTLTSASFVLRKYYLSLLYHFEQVYYFRKEEPSPSVADHSKTANGSTSPHVFDDFATSDQFSVSTNLEEGSLITGTIDGKFDYGYIVTMNLGSETLKGVLYHTPMASNAPQAPTISAPAQSSRKKRHLKSKESSHLKPNRNRSGYNFFFAENYARLKPMYQGQERAITRKLGELWNKLPDAEKQVYKEKGARDKERYKAEMLEYKSSQNFLPQ